MSLNTDTSLQPENRHLEEAAGWYVRLCSGEASAVDHAEWQLWHDSSPECRAAWCRVERLQGLLSQAPAQARRSLSAAGLGRRRRLAACAGVFLVCGLAFMLSRPFEPEVQTEWISSAEGERRSLTLPDGTRLLLGSASTVGVTYSKERRQLRLQEGDIQVQTGHDVASGQPIRPLVVLARDGSVTPLGTRFTLQQNEAGTTLAVQEHAVELRLSADPGAPLRLEAGQRVHFSAGGAGPLMTASGADDAWTRGQLVVLDMPLDRFAAELAHQSGKAVECDPRIAALRVSGSYLVDAPGRSLASLAALLPLRVENTAEGGFRLLPRK